MRTLPWSACFINKDTSVGVPAYVADLGQLEIGGPECRKDSQYQERT